jgi:hypothetical protein
MAQVVDLEMVRIEEGIARGEIFYAGNRRMKFVYC